MKTLYTYENPKNIIRKNHDQSPSSDGGDPMIWPYTLGRSHKRGPALIDDWLPEGAYMLEHHDLDVGIPPTQAFKAISDLRLNDLPFVRALFRMRGIPHRNELSLSEMFSTRPFLVLAEERESEIVFGIVGPFWKFHHDRTPPEPPRSPEDFRRALADRRMAAIGNFRADPLPRQGESRIWTETWCYTPEISSFILFSAYWLAIGPWSAWIRRMFLDGARHKTLPTKRV